VDLTLALALEEVAQASVPRVPSLGGECEALRTAYAPGRLREKKGFLGEPLPNLIQYGYGHDVDESLRNTALHSIQIATVFCPK